MKRSKKLFDSKVLLRTAHLDVFELSAEPEFLFVFFGGSGIDEEEYFQRSRTVVPVFDHVLDEVQVVPMTFLYVTSPFDVPLLRFAAQPALAEEWNRHVLSELLEPWDGLPYFLASFSGGAALAFHGIHEPKLCIGGAAMGFDGLGARFLKPDHWRDPLRFYCGFADLVCNHPANRSVIDELVCREQAEVFQLRTGSHRLADYTTEDCLGREIKHAHRLACSG
ncbi:MAG: hypothetical protein KDB03_06340 [Planctomycetales bacterium]|nr:hypothetical protein [Planctomycetales bacterium]